MICETCGGKGFLERNHGLHMAYCNACKGTGKTRDTRFDGLICIEPYYHREDGQYPIIKECKFSMVKSEDTKRPNKTTRKRRTRRPK